MKQISSMDLYFLTKELKILENQRIDSFYLEDGIFYLKVYVKNLGNRFLKFEIGKSIYLTEEKEESSFPSSFVAYLRKNLKNTFIRKFDQIENERILKIEIEKKIDETNFSTQFLYLEIFAPGNVILTDSDNIIKNMLFRKKFKDRKVIAKEKYELPPKKEISIFNLNEDTLKKELKESDLSIVKFLAIKFGLGGKFAEEIIFLSKIPKDTPSNNLDKNNILSLMDSIKEIINSKTKAYLILNNKMEMIDFIPIDFKSIENTKKEKIQTFNLALEKYFSKADSISKKDGKEKEFDLALKRLKNRLHKQEIQLKSVLEESEKFTLIGNKIYENYSLIEDLLNTLNKTAKEKGWDYVENVIKTSNDSRLEIIEKLDYKNNEIEINLK